VKPDELRKALSKVRNALEDDEQADLQIETVIENFNRNNQNKKIILNTNTNIYVIEIKDLVHCESVGNYTTVYIKGMKDVMISRTLKDFEGMLAPYGFFRVHQSHLINMEYVETYEKKGGGRVKLKTGEVLAVSSRKKDNFIKAIQAYSDIIQI
jgi:two-component system LytT family response regulator